MEDRGGDGRPAIHWHRAQRDGLPFRGTPLPLREEEYDELERVLDANVATFDTSNPEQRAKLVEILDRSYNGWYRVFCVERRWIDRDGAPVMFVYLEWAEPFLEANKRSFKDAPDRPE